MKHRNSEGFTLIEILIVVLIIGAIMAGVATALFSQGTEAQIKMVSVHVDNLSAALELYKLDNGRYPTEEQGLDALVREPGSDPRPRRYPPAGYAKDKQLVDPWGMPYQYRLPGQRNPHSFDLFSIGPDGVEGGATGEGDDIGNWSPDPL